MKRYELRNLNIIHMQVHAINKTPRFYQFDVNILVYKKRSPFTSNYQ